MWPNAKINGWMLTLSMRMELLLVHCYNDCKLYLRRPTLIKIARLRRVDVTASKCPVQICRSYTTFPNNTKQTSVVQTCSLPTLDICRLEIHIIHFELLFCCTDIIEKKCLKLQLINVIIQLLLQQFAF